MTSIADQFDSVWTYVSEMPSNDMTSFLLLVVGGLALHEWALIHYLGGFLYISNSWADDQGPSMTMGNITGESGIDYTGYTYPKHTNRIYIQHGINLFIAGFFSDLAIVVMMFNSSAAPMIALVPFLVDVGYFTAIDLPHLGNVFAQAQTYIVSTGLICTAIFTYLNSDKGDWALLYMILFVASSVGLILAGIVNIIVKLTIGGWEGTPLLMDGSTDFTGETML